VITKLRDSEGKETEIKKFVLGKDFEVVKQKDESTIYTIPMKAKLAAKPAVKVELSVKPELENKKDFQFYTVSDYKYEWGMLPESEVTGKAEISQEDLKKGKKIMGTSKQPQETSFTANGDSKGGMTVAGEAKFDNASEDETTAAIGSLGLASLGGLKDTIFKLTMVKTLPKGTQEQLRKANLNLVPAVARCNRMNGAGACEPVWGTMAVVKCQKGYLK
jgi:hypothetical protein